MTEITVEPTAQPTEPVVEPTAEAGNEPTPKTFTQEDLDKIVKERLDRERKKYADYNDLKAAKQKLDELEKAKLSDEEKAKAKLKELEEKIAEKEKELEERSLRDLKRSMIEQAIADGKMELPKGKTIESLVKRCLGTTEDEIAADVDDLIGFFPKSEPPKNRGLGTQVAQVVANEKSVRDQLNEVNAKLLDKNTSHGERSKLIDLSIRLNRRLQKGEA